MRGITLTLTFLLLAVGGCANKPAKPVAMKAQVVAAPSLNPDRTGASKPVVVRIFQLRTGGSFESQDFYSLYQSPETALAEDLLAKRELIMTPGATEMLEAEFNPETRVIGVMAAFRDIENARWRAMVPLPEEKLIKFFDRRQMLVNLNDRTVTLQFAKPPKK